MAKWFCRCWFIASTLSGVAAGVLLGGLCLVYIQWGGWTIVLPILMVLIIIGAASAWIGF